MVIKEMNGEDKFLVRITDPPRPQYLKEFDGQYITSTETPSYALHCSYVEADQWCRRLRKNHYPQSVVANLFGQMMTAGMVKVELQAISLAVENPSLPRAWGDLDKIPAAECVRRRRSQLGFREAEDRIYETPRPAPKSRLQ
jgi:hypothetical protein